MVNAAGHLRHVDVPNTLLRHRNKRTARLNTQLIGQVAAPHDHLALPFLRSAHRLLNIHRCLSHG